MSGVSQLSASAVKPAGVEAAVALRYLAESETGRHALLSQAHEDFFVDLAELTVSTAKYIHASNTEAPYYSRYRTSTGYEPINWGDIDLDRDAYELQCFPSNYLPITPAGRIQAVQEMLSAGFISKTQAISLLALPDLEQFQSLEASALEDVDRQIENMLGNGKPERPEPFQDLELAAARVVSALLRARQDGAPEDRQRLLLDYLDEVQTLLLPPEEAMPPEGMSTEPGPPPEGMPVPIPEAQAPDLELATPPELLE